MGTATTDTYAYAYASAMLSSIVKPRRLWVDRRGRFGTWPMNTTREPPPISADAGFLKRVTITDGAGNPLDHDLYRYYRAGNPLGYDGALQYVVRQA